MNDFYTLNEFIETATRNRKYPASTAQGLRAAVKLFGNELNDDELNSLDKVKSNLDQIYQSVFLKNKNNFTASSLQTYHSRFLKVINDYEKYGTDPTKMANWNPKIIVREPKKKQADQNTTANQSNQSPNETSGTEPIPENMHRLELALRPDVKFVIIVPQDLKSAEAATLNAIMTSLVVDKKDGERDE